MNEKLIGMLLSGLGLNPEEIKGQVINLQNWTINSIKNLDSRLRVVESDITQINANLKYIINLLEVSQNGRANDQQHAFNGSNGSDGSANGSAIAVVGCDDSGRIQ